MKIENPIFLNSNKKNVIATRKVNVGDRELTQKIHISKFDIDGNITKDWKDLIEAYSEDEITELTLEHEKNELERIRVDQEKREIDKENTRLRHLFSKKLEVFELDWVKNLDDKDFKKKIRKSSNETEVMLHTMAKYLEVLNDNS